MAGHLAMSGPSERPTQGELLDEVSRYQDGVSAVDLAEIFTKKGYDEYSVQRAIQRALDKGALELGSKLRLYPACVAA